MFGIFGDRSTHGESFFRTRGRESHFHKGDLKYVVLDLLKEKPRYGYEIIRALEEQSQGLYTPSPGVVYPTLQMLEEMGYAESQERDGKKVYSITEGGLQFLTDQKDSADEVRNHIKNHWSVRNIGRIAMIMKEYRVLEHLLSRALRDLDADKTQRIREVLSGTYQEIKKILEE